MKQNELLLVIKPFVSWCAAQGIVSPLEIRVRPEDGYRYVCMAAVPNNQQPQPQQQQQQQSSKENDKIINLIQCPLNGKASLIAPSMEELADCLEFEVSLGEDSHFYPYMQVLPQEFPGMPRFWPPEQLYFVSQFDDGLLASELVSTTAASLSLSSASASASWARAVVDSRANHLPYGDGDVMVSSSYALTPFLDMINHDGNVVTSAYIEMNSRKDDKAEILHLDIQAPADEGILLVGDEVKTSYGKFTNIEMLLNYGFCEMNGNPWNRESFYVRTLSHPKPILVTCLDKDGSVDRMSLGAVRKSLATTEELAMAERLLGRCTSSSASASASASNTQTASAPPSMTMVPFLSKRNEEETYALIAGYMDAAVHKAKKGAQEALQIKASLLETSSSLSSSTTTILQHGIMADYLMRRARTLQNSLDRINVLLEHPQVFQAQEHALMLHQQQQQ